MRPHSLGALFPSAMAMASAAPGLAQSLALDHASLEAHRAALRAGDINPLRSPLIEAIDGIAGRAAAMREFSMRSADPTLGNPNPWAGVIDADDYHEGFEAAETHISLASADDFVPYPPQTSNWAAGPAYVGVVNNAIAQTGPNWNPDGEGFDRQGVVGGPDPDGLRGQFLAFPRGTIEPQSEPGSFFAARFGHPPFAPTLDEPATVVFDMYLDDISNFVMYRPYSNANGVIIMLMLMGGFDFHYFLPFVNEDFIVDRFIVLGRQPGAVRQFAEFFGAADPHRVAEREWFQIAVRLTADSFSVWTRDSTTIGVHGFEQDSMYDGAPGDDARGAFAGEIFAQDWLQVFPGVEDDPSTTLVEGNGPATTLEDLEADVLLDAGGSPAGRSMFANVVDAAQFVTGDDPDFTAIPDFQPHDWHIDNYTVLGEPWSLPEPPPFDLPLIDDFEAWGPWPVSIQGSHIHAERDTGTLIANDQNHTPGGSQSARHQIIFADGVPRTVLQRIIPGVEAASGGPVETTFRIRVDGPRATRSARASDRRHDRTAFHLLYGALGADGGADDRVYARLPNPNHDASTPEPLLPGPFAQHIEGANTRFVNAPLVDGEGEAITIPQGEWIETRLVLASPPDAPGAVRVFIDGVEAFPDGSVEGIDALTAASGALDELAFGSAFEAAGLGNVLWVDDIMVDGPRKRIADVLTSGGAPFDDDPLFELPYIDGLESYGVDVELHGQGATPWLDSLGFEPSQFNILPLPEGASVDADTAGFFYTIERVRQGTLPDGLGAGDRVFVVDNIPPRVPPLPDFVPGVTHSTRVGVLHSDAAFPRQLAKFDWVLENQAAEPWDGQTPVLGRFWASFLPRWTAAPEDTRLIADPTGAGKGAVLSVTNAEVSQGPQPIHPYLRRSLSSRFPAARAAGDEIVTLSFDLWIAIDDLAVGPRGRLAWLIDGPGERHGPGPEPGAIARVVFGGPNNFLDNYTFDASGEILNESDGLPDTFLRGQPATVGGDNRLFADPTKLYIARPNPQTGFGQQPTILEQASYTVPGNTWIRCTAEITGEGDWTLSFDDGMTTFVVSGEALESSGAVVGGTDSLDLSIGEDPGADGFAPTDPIAFTPLAPDAAPEGGLAPLDNPANANGDFNDYVNPEYFYFEISHIFGPGINPDIRPTVQDVDPATGALTTLRKLDTSDVVVLWNNKSTQAFAGPAGERFSETIARHPQFMISEDGTTVTVRGEWRPLGLPGEAGVVDPAPNGGVANAGPPYNGEAPFRSILMGSIVHFPPLVGEPLPGRAEWLVDNVRLDVQPPCRGDLVASSPDWVDAADLAALLGEWGAAESEADLNADGVVDGADLGMLLGAWGPCP